MQDSPPSLPRLDLHPLLEGKIPFLRVPAFWPVEADDRFLTGLQSKLKASPHSAYGRKTPGVEYLGNRYLGGLDAEGKERYFQEAEQISGILRSLTAPRPSPFDLLLELFGSSWDQGTEVGSMDGRKMAPCVVRRISEGGAVEPHQDGVPGSMNLIQEAPLEEVEILAFNLFLEVPSQGGEFETWNLKFNHAEYDEHRLKGSYALDRAQLPPPQCRVRPKPGDLYLLNASRVHAVRPVDGNRRTTLSGFAAVVSPQHPLLLWA